MSDEAQHAVESDHGIQQQQQQLCDYVYTCRMCRRVLFRDSECVRHEPANQNATSSNSKGFRYRRPTTDHDDQGEPCTSYFLDPDVSTWISAESREAAAAGLEVAPDTVYCPNAQCHAKLGTQSWNGLRCSCGAWVTPAFKILARAVDKMPVQQ